MLSDIESERMEHVKLTTGRRNCIGAILYIKGVIDEDSYVGKEEQRWHDGIVDRYLSGLVPVGIPVIGSVTVFYDFIQFRQGLLKNEIGHLGMVVDENPFMLFYRTGMNDGQIRTYPLDEVIQSYWWNCPFVEFYSEPHRLLNLEEIGRGYDRRELLTNESLCNRIMIP